MKRTKSKKTNTETKARPLLSMSYKYKVVLLQASTKTTTFKSQQTKKIYKIFHNINCNSSYVINLMEYIYISYISYMYIYCIQYLGIPEISCNIRLNNLRKDMRKSTQYWLANIFNKKAII